jgi:HlyD family secretion protein
VVSPDTSADPKTGATFYTVRIAIPAEELGRLNGLKLVPGMPVESFIQTEERTVLSYLTKPLTDQALKAFRER